MEQVQGPVQQASNKSVFMLRVMTYKDIPAVAAQWNQERAKTCFAQFHVDWSEEQCAGFLMEQINRPNQLLLAIEQDGQIVAACGAMLAKEWLIPHPLVVNEWMWWGSSKRVVVELLMAMKTWGRDNHAQFIRYVLNQPGQSQTKCLETVRWEAL